MTKQQSILDSVKQFTKPTAITMFFYGFSAGVPILLIFSSLSIWLREAGVDKSAVTYFSWAALGYSFKFIWAPLVDQLPMPILQKILGRRRSWILVTQILIILSIAGMAMTDPSGGQASLTAMALFAVLLGFTSATQDISIDAYRIESDTPDMQALLASTYMTGYRIGMLVAGAGALILADQLGSSSESYSYGAWQLTYFAMAGVMLIGVVTTFIVKEPSLGTQKRKEYSNLDYIKFAGLFLVMGGAFAWTFFHLLNVVYTGKPFLTEVFGKTLATFVWDFFRLGVGVSIFVAIGFTAIRLKLVNEELVSGSYVDPVKDFFTRYGGALAFLLLGLVGFYRVSDIVLGVISNVFYIDIGFTKTQIATVVKTFGVVMTIVGTLMGGVLTVRFGVVRMLFWGAVLSAVTNVLFMALASTGPSMPMLYLVISADNLAGGLATAAFVAFLSSLTNISFTATQYAIFTSLMTLFPKLLGGYTGTLVELMGYEMFFAFTTLLGVPVMVLVHFSGKRLKIQESQS